MLIHHIWMQGFEFSPVTPLEIAQLKWGNSQHMYWDEKSLTELIQQYYPQWLTLFQKLPQTIMKCDVARAFILHRFGGCYADIDYKPSDSFAEFLLKIPKDRIIVPRYFGLGSFLVPNNNLIFSAPKEEYWIQTYLPYVNNYLISGGTWLDNYCSMIYPPFHVFAFTGPLALWRTHRKLRILNEKDTNTLGENPGNVSNWIQYKRSTRHLVLGGVLTIVFLWFIIQNLGNVYKFLRFSRINMKPLENTTS